MNTPRKLLLCLAIVQVALYPVNAADVWVQFGAPFQTQLDLATAGAGVANFSPAERSTIESNIIADLNTVFSSYTITFHTADPGGTRTVLDYAATTGGGAFGSAPLDFGNASGGGTARVYSANFDNFIESFEPRATQISEISASLAGTGAHELGHTYGSRHQSAYSGLLISPANYANTANIQDAFIMGTGSTGLSEGNRETLRSLAPWSKVIMDVAGGTSFGGVPLVNSPVMTEFEAGDAGNFSAAAQPLTSTFGETSNRFIGLVRGDLDTTSADVDFYSFSTISPGSVTAELWSIDRFGSADEFDGRLTLYDTDGSTVLFSNDNVFYSGNSYNSGTLRELDPYLLNIPLPSAGTYFLEVSASDPLEETVGDDYILLFGSPIEPVPEPARTLLSIFGLAAVVLRRRRGKL